MNQAKHKKTTDFWTKEIATINSETIAFLHSDITGRPGRFSYFAAYVYLLNETHPKSSAEITEVSKGETLGTDKYTDRLFTPFRTSVSDLAKTWGWCRPTTTKFLHKLEELNSFTFEKVHNAFVVRRNIVQKFEQKFSSVESIRKWSVQLSELADFLDSGKPPTTENETSRIMENLLSLYSIVHFVDTSDTQNPKSFSPSFEDRQLDCQKDYRACTDEKRDG